MNSTAVAGQVLKITPLIDNDTKYILSIVFQIVLFTSTGIFGVVANTINIIVYRNQGLRDSITLGFFALSISDLVVVVTTMTISPCYIADLFFPHIPIRFVGFYFVSSANVRQMAYSFSTLLTAFLSLERCCCVVLPFKVKMIFTRKRTFLVIIALLLFHIACYAPIFTTYHLRWLPDASQNNTKILRVWYAPNREKIQAFNFTLMSIVTPVCAQVVVICCSVIMINGLRASSKFRQMAAGKGNEKEEEEGGLSSRDARLVKAMVFVGCILTLCNIPYLALVSGILTVPELNHGKAYHNTYSFVFSVTILLALVNASVNFFVYYNISNKYNQGVKEMSCFKKKEKRQS